MKKGRLSFLGGLSVQLLAFTVLPLTLLLLLIVFGSISLHQRDMRSLVGERDERAVQAAAAVLASELHHRAAGINSAEALLEAQAPPGEIRLSPDQSSDFDGGMAFLDANHRLIASSAPDRLWTWVASSDIRLASRSSPGPLFSESFRFPGSEPYFVIVSRFSSSQNMIVAGAFSPQDLAGQVLSASYPASPYLAIYLVDGQHNLLFAGGTLGTSSLPADHPGAIAALQGKSGTTYIERGHAEQVVAYTPVAETGWALITEEDWQSMVSPSLELTQMAPLILVPAFLLTLLALGFVGRQIVQPLQRLEHEASALAWGDFEAVKQPVGGIAEIQHLQVELRGMSDKVQAAQEGLRDYIGAITSAQEEERLRLARELHDETIQEVIALKQRLQLAGKSVKDPGTRATLQELEKLAEQTIDGLRRMTRALRPIYLEDLGLVTALEMLVKETQQAYGLDLELRIEGIEQRLSREIELALYRIAQGALSNVVRHAGASHASLLLKFGDLEITLEVKDDGIGFVMPKSPTDLAPEGHFGLLGIRERADLIGGRLEVQSAPGHGTRLSVQLKKS